MQKVFCFGELLLRLSPTINGEWIVNHSMPVFIGGAELNVATALARWQVPVGYGTALPANYLSKEIIAYINEQGIDTGKIILGGSRIGTYYLPQGADLKNAGVIYDRLHSSFYELQPGQINWEQVLHDASWFHFSAISPALNANLAAVCNEAVAAASKKGITISVDLNYREKLWQYGKQPCEVMPHLVQHCDVIMGNIWSAEKMLGVSVDPFLADDKKEYIGHSFKTSAEIIKRFPKCRQVANTFRFDGNEGIRYYATLFAENNLYSSGEYNATGIVDKIGSGDAFMAGLIYGNYKNWSPQPVIDFAAASAFHKLFIMGDATTASVEQITKTCQQHA